MKQQATDKLQENISSGEEKGRLIARILVDIFCLGVIYYYIHIHGSGVLKTIPGGVEVFAFSVYGIKAHLILMKHIMQFFGGKIHQTGSIQSQIIDSCILTSTVALSIFFNYM